VSNRPDRELTPAELEAFGQELDALRQRSLADLGEADARYIRRVRGVVRLCCWSGRTLLMLGWFPPTWLLGTFLLGLGKILENMELGRNVMHGQYDWMNDPEFAGRQYEWGIVGPADFWRHTHNHVHHTDTNVLGMDDDVGYGVVRLFPDLPARRYAELAGAPDRRTLRPALQLRHLVGAIFDYTAAHLDLPFARCRDGVTRVKGSGRRRPHGRRPPTPPCVRFRTRRFRPCG